MIITVRRRNKMFTLMPATHTASKDAKVQDRDSRLWWLESTVQCSLKIVREQHFSSMVTSLNRSLCIIIAWVPQIPSQCLRLITLNTSLWSYWITSFLYFTHSIVEAYNKIIILYKFGLLCAQYKQHVSDWSSTTRVNYYESGVWGSVTVNYVFLTCPP